MCVRACVRACVGVCVCVCVCVCEQQRLRLVCMFVYVCSANFSPSIWLILRPFVCQTRLYVRTYKRTIPTFERSNERLSVWHAYVHTNRRTFSYGRKIRQMDSRKDDGTHILTCIRRLQTDRQTDGRTDGQKQLYTIQRNGQTNG